MSRLTEAAQSAFLALGVEVHRKRDDPLRFLARRNIRTVLDIGANEGQFARKARKVLPESKIYSFEPLPDVFRKLERLALNDPNFEAINVGVGDQTGEVDFEENNFTASSSILRLTKAGTEAFPETACTKKIRIPMTTLDIWAGARELADPLLVKMDVQGFEDRVIRGGQKTISRAEVVISEVSFATLYEGQALFEDSYDRMGALGFRFAGTIDNLYHRGTGEILQADAIFIRG